MSILSDSILIESKSARDSQLLEIPNDRAAAILDKAKAICFAAWEGVGIATTEQIAAFYEVEVEAVQKVVQRNRDELISDGLQILRGKKLKDAMDSLSIASPSDKFAMDKLSIAKISNLTAWTPRPTLRLGMLLQSSEVAKQVRTILLDGFEAIGKQPQLPSSYTDRALALADQLKQEKGLTYAQALSAARGLLKDEATALERAAKARLARLLPRQRGLLATFKREGSLTLHDLVHWLGFNEADMHQDLAELESRGLIDRFVDDDGQPYYRASQTDGTAIDQTPRLDRSVETAR